MALVILAQAFVCGLAMFQRPRGSAAPWVRARSRTPAPVSGPVLPELSGRPLAADEASDASLEYGGQIVPRALARSFQRVLDVADSLHRPRAPTTLHGVLRHSWIPTARSLDGPSPRQNLVMLRGHASTGGNLGAALDEVVHGRMGNLLAEGSCTTYQSHVRLILQFCLLLNASPLPAERSTVMRFIGLFNNARTLRGALAAWRQLHIRSHVLWVLEGDVYCSMLQRAVRRSMAPRAPRHALRKPLAVRLVLMAVDKGGQWLEVAAIVALAYVFGLRVPSELLRQRRAGLWSYGGTAIHYGPIGRKHRNGQVTLMRSCICSSVPVLCPHIWARYVQEALPLAKSFTMTGADFNRHFQTLHRELSAGDARGWTSHAMRRGMALDVLEEHGFGAMLRAGDWNSTGAFAYASREHVEQRLVGQMFANFSDDDR